MKTKLRLTIYSSLLMILLVLMLGFKHQELAAQDLPAITETTDSLALSDSVQVEEIIPALPYENYSFQPVENGTGETLETDAELYQPDRSENRTHNREREQTLLFYVFCFILILYGFVRWQFEELLYIGPRILSNVRMMENYYEEPVSHSLLPRILLDINTVLIIGLLAFFALKTFIVGQADIPTWQLILIGLGVVASFFILKAALQRILSLILPDKKAIELYLFNRRYTQWLLGLLLLPVLVLIAFAGIIPKSYLLIIAAIIILILVSWQYIRGLQLSQHLLKVYPFHFFLYFCTLEIAPILILGGLINRFG